jgi:hypothetical protein
VLALAIVSILLILFFVCRVILKKLFGMDFYEENKDSRIKKKTKLNENNMSNDTWRQFINFQSDQKD